MAFNGLITLGHKNQFASLPLLKMLKKMELK